MKTRSWGWGRRNVRGSPSMEWSPRSDDGSQRQKDDHGSSYQTKERRSSSRAAEMVERWWYQTRETWIFSTVSWRTWNPAGFYSEDWDELQQEEDELQTPDKWQRISQMVFCGRCLEIHLDEAGCISSSCTQHQGGICSACEAKAWSGERVDKRSLKNHPSTWQGGEDYQMVSKLYLAEKEMNRLFNDDK